MSRQRFGDKIAGDEKKRQNQNMFRTRLDAVWPDAAQRARCLEGLLDDGLVRLVVEDRYAL